jgi:hypothetical protein
MQRTATCACGAASISVRGQASQHNVCHCTNCKRRSGSAFGISAYFQRTQLVERRGEMQVYAFHHQALKHDQERHFCRRCGTTLYWFMSSHPELIGIAGGCFEDGALGPPTASVNDAQRLPWLTLAPACRVEG